MESGALVKQEFDKLPRINSARDLNCIVPLIESKNKFNKEDLAKKYNQSIPDDLILSLKQAEIPKEFLGPPSKRTLQSIRPSVPSVLRKPDNAWNFEKQREKLKFLTEQPICSCGAGKDISFIYDCAFHKTTASKQISKYDISSIRAPEQMLDEPVQVAETLIPEEYRIVKNLGVWPIKAEEQQFTTIAEDHRSHLTVFPSLRPTGRNEVIHLKHTMDALLKRVGADIIDQKGPTQLHNLLEIIKQEQDIYNIIFHEIIRQVTVECKERGEILSKLRERYANLLSRVPREIKSLHEEIIAQRALDRRLTEELMQFKSTIATLTDELAQVKDHDKKIGEQATNYQKDLQQALLDAQKNASLLSEYHGLYELQRKRLEKTVESLTDERELWIKACYTVALKLTQENRLNTAKRLNISERSWSKLAKSFALLMSDKDTKDLNDIQKLTESWKEIMNEIRYDVNLKESQFKQTIEQIQVDILQLKSFYITNTFDEKGNLIQVPDTKKIFVLVEQMKRILNLSMRESENFTGDAVLISEDKIKKAERIVYQLVQLCNKITSRHEPSKDKEKLDKYMKYEKLQIDVKKLQEQYKNRSSGDNGLSRSTNSLNNSLDVWIQKLSSQLVSEQSGKNKIRISEAEWQAFCQAIDEWLEYASKSSKSLGWPLKEQNDSNINDLDDSDFDMPKIVVHESLFNEIQQWLTAICHFIDTQDACLIDEVEDIHRRMIHWMIQSLIRLAPEREELSAEAKKLIYNSNTTPENLESNGIELIAVVEKFTNSLVARCNLFLSENDHVRLPGQVEQVEKDLKNLTHLQSDSQEWVYTVKLLIAELHGDKSHRKNISDRLTYHSAKKSLQDLGGGGEEEELEEARSRSSRKSSEAKYYISRPNMPSQQSETDLQTNLDASQDFEAKTETNTMNLEDEMRSNNETASNQLVVNPTAVFEVLSSDSNTQRKFLEHIDFDDSQHLTEVELKNTVFNAYKTIEKLQTELLSTEERAQKSENRVADLELQLKQAFEKIRELEKN